MITTGHEGKGIQFGITKRDTDHQTLTEQLGLQNGKLITVKQVHGISVLTIRAEDELQHHSEAVADAIITNRCDIGIAVKVADCCGVVLFDRRQSAVAVVHSGWRGTAQGVVSAAISTMQHDFETEPQELFAWLSPCAGVQQYQVGADVYSVLSTYCIRDNTTPGRWFFDNNAALIAELMSFGIPQSHIENSAICTITNTEYHSFRRDGSSAGRGLVYVKLTCE